MRSTTAALILAAGQGKRMRSSLPKVLHPCAEVPLVAHVVKLAIVRKCAPIVVVVSPEGRRVREMLTARFPDVPLVYATQETPLGTGDATRVGLEAIPDFDGNVVLLYGDTPLLSADTVGRLQEAAENAAVAFLTADLDDPSGYGRVVRDDRGEALRVVEDRDATAEERTIKEVNAGVYVASAALFRSCVAGLASNNAQNEFYLTDVVAMAAQDGGASAVKVADAEEIGGVNSRRELARAEAILRQRLIAHHQDRGVTFLDPQGTFLGADVKLGNDVTIGVGVQIYGQSKIGDRVQLQGPTVIQDCQIASDAVVHAFSHLQDAAVSSGASVGPFARLRPGAQLDEGARVGNFVEIKKTRLGKGSKANHLAYLGDAQIGPDSNIGAGTITCNYDGFGKHKTELGKGVFIGSNATLVAPLKLAEGSYVAAGSTITHDVPADSLAFGRARQATREGYAAHLRERLMAEKSKKEK